MKDIFVFNDHGCCKLIIILKNAERNINKRVKINKLYLGKCVLTKFL